MTRTEENTAAAAMGLATPDPTMLTVTGLLCAAGVLTGWALRGRLRRGGYRGPLEWHRPVPDPRWLPPALGLVFPLLGAALADRPGAPVVAVAYLLGAVLLAVLAAVDLDVRRLPDALTLLAHPGAFIALALASLAATDAGALGRAVLGGVAAVGLYGILHSLGRRRGRPAMGLGDVKLAGPIGMLLAWLGWESWFAGMYAGLVLGGIAALALLLAGRATRATQLPHGPAMALGSLVGVLAAAPWA